MVRDTVVRLGMPDVVETITGNFDDDEETSMISGLHNLWRLEFGHDAITKTALEMRWAQGHFADRVQQIFGDDRMTLRAFYGQFSKICDRPVDGVAFRRLGSKNRIKRQLVVW